jgi:aminopeptidase N
MIRGTETLVYRNNSPDSLGEVYFRLYWNLFKTGSYAQRSAKHSKQYYSLHGDEHQGITLTKFSILRDQKEVDLAYTVDNTIMKANLPAVMPPGDSIVFSIAWDGCVPSLPERTGYQGRDFNIAQWYPQIAVYDKFGWHREQYTGPGEFHNDYGTFYVNISIPKNFILGHTGVLLNPNEVYPDSVIVKLREAEGKDETIRVADFSNRELIAADTTLTTWKFHAENVRDFAWTANEHYIWDVAHWNGVAIHSLYFPDKSEYWREVAAFGRHAIKFFSEHFGPYEYPSAFVVEGVVGGGMEYPGIVFIAHIGDPFSHSLFGVVTHELGHEWYPMMISSNETEYAFQDEGFTTFITTLAQEDYYGRYNNSYNWEKLPGVLAMPNSDERQGNMASYISLARTGYEEPVATNSDRWEEPNLWGTSVYPKTASVMFMLQYVVGDSVFSKLMLEYYNRWKFKHPYPEDFFSLTQEVSGIKDLRWFFDEWLYRTNTCDYVLSKIDHKRIEYPSNKPPYRTTVTIRRNGSGVMPLDVELILADGSRTTINVPVDVWFNDVWLYKVTVDLPQEPKSGEINPDKRIALVNRLHTHYPRPWKVPVTLRFDNTFFNITPVYEYLVQWRPSFWYNDVDGFKIGLKLNGSYLDDLHKLTGWGWFGVVSKRLDYDFSYSSALPTNISPLSNLILRGYRIEGRQSVTLDFTKQLRRHYSYPPYHTLSVALSHLKAWDTEYLLNPLSWEEGVLNRILLNYSYSNYGNSWNVNFRMNFESDILRSDFRYNKITFDLREYSPMPLGWNFAARFYGGFGSGNVPLQTKYFLAGGDPIEQLNNPFFRSKGMLPSTVRDHALMAGGGDLRGYFDQNLAGDRIYALNLEIRFPSVIPFLGPQAGLLSLLKSDFFFDAGKVWSRFEEITNKDIRWDAGFGLRLPITGLFRSLPFQSNIFNSIGLSVIRVYFPVYLSDPLPTEDKLKFRWVVGLSESF